MLHTWKYPINVVLLLIAVGLEVFYSICGGSCSYLRGDIFGMNLSYVGIIFAVILIGLSLLKQDWPILSLVSAVMGVEIVLVAFQVSTERKDYSDKIRGRNPPPLAAIDCLSVKKAPFSSSRFLQSTLPFLLLKSWWDENIRE